MEARSYTISLPHGQVTVSADTRDGSKDLLLFIHGLGCSRRSFRDVWNQPEFEPYSVVCVDLPGFGDSPASEVFSYRMEDHAVVCAGIVERFPGKNIHVVGHSMGGAIGLLLPPKFLHSVSSFFNVEGNLNPEDCIFGSRRASSATPKTIVEEVLPAFQRSSSTWRESGLDVASPDAFLKSSRSLVEWSDNGKLLEAFHGLASRKAYVYGAENRHHPTVATVSGIECIEIPDAGHFVMNDNPKAFYERLLVFVRSA